MFVKVKKLKKLEKLKILINLKIIFHGEKENWDIQIEDRPTFFYLNIMFRNVLDKFPEKEKFHFHFVRARTFTNISPEVDRRQNNNLKCCRLLFCCGEEKVMNF